jgi:hypothetical protein
VELDRDPLGGLRLERGSGVALDRLDPLRVPDCELLAEGISASASIITPLSSVYSWPVSTRTVARGSRSRFRTFWDLA